MRWARWAVVVAVLACLGAVRAHAEHRVALVIGNDAYRNVDPLQKAVADSASYTEMLRGKGFDVTLKQNLTRSEMDEAIAGFADAISPGDTAVFIYSGHGWSDGSQNFLLGVDVPKNGSKEFLARVSIPLKNGSNGVIDSMDQKGAALKVAIIDACRDNPFGAAAGGRGLGLTRGLARVDPPGGTFVAFSAGAGQTALDRLSDSDRNANSVFTRVFVPLLARNLNLLDAIKTAQTDVATLARTVNHDQRPAYYDEVVGTACLSGSCASETGASPPNSPAGAPTPPDTTAADFRAAESVNTKAAYLGFLGTHRTGPLADVARSRIDAMDQAELAQQAQAADAARRAEQTRQAAAEQQAQEAARREQLARLEEEGAPRALPSGGPAYVVGNLRPDGDNFLSLRAAPSGSSQELRRLGPGTGLAVGASQGAWLFVVTADGARGWVSARYVVPAGAPASRPGPGPAGTYSYVTGLDPAGDNFLSLKAAPDVGSSRLMKMGPGTRLRIIGRSGSWSEVELLDGTRGWAASRYIGCCAAR